MEKQAKFCVCRVVGVRIKKKLSNKFELNKRRQFNNFQFRDGRFAKKLLFLFFFFCFSRFVVVVCRMFGKSHKSLLFDLCSAVFLERNSAPLTPLPRVLFIFLKATVASLLFALKSSRRPTQLNKYENLKMRAVDVKNINNELCN